MTDFNPRFPRGKRRPDCRKIYKRFRISIHASRGGSDLCSVLLMCSLLPISIHASRGGSDPPTWAATQDGFIFQSTLPAGEATFFPMLPSQISQNFNPRFPRGKRQKPFPLIFPKIPYFNPRFPRGKRRRMDSPFVYGYFISIHASRGGSDHAFIVHGNVPRGISIHASRGGSDPLRFSP